MKKYIYKNYLSNGNLDVEYEYGGDEYKKNGYYKNYWRNGILYCKLHYKNNIEYGLRELFHESGKKYREELYIN